MRHKKMPRSHRSGADGVVRPAKKFRRSDHPVRSVKRTLRGILLMSPPPLLCEDGNDAPLCLTTAN